MTYAAKYARMIDQLISNADAHHDPQGTERRRSADVIYILAAECDEAWQRIADAPHGRGCSWFATASGLSCNCWKSKP